MLFHGEPNPDLLYLVAIFAIEPSADTRSLSGSLGRVGWDGELEWHVEVVQVGRARDRLSTGAALAVVYMRIEQREYPNVVSENDVEVAFKLLETLIAPKEWEAEGAVRIHLVEAWNYRGDGDAEGGVSNPSVVLNVARGALGLDSLDWALLEQHPQLRVAIRFYTRGIGAASERFRDDACINYARCLECLVGSSKGGKRRQRGECDRLGLDFGKVGEFLGKTRGRYSIAHALHKVEGKGPQKLKEEPTREVEAAARELARQAIESFIERVGPVDREVELRKGIRYRGIPPVNTNLPLPLETLWARMMAWENTSPGLLSDTVTTAEAARQSGITKRKVRELLKRRLVAGIKTGPRWKVSLTSVQLCLALADQTAMDYRGGTFMRIKAAAQEAGLDPLALRQLVREKRIYGRLAGDRRRGLPRDMVDVISLRYFRWRQRREAITRRLRLPRPWQKRLPTRRWIPRRSKREAR